MFHPESIRLGKVGGNSESDAHPHVKHLGSSVAQGQVADHHLMGSFNVDDRKSHLDCPGHLQDIQKVFTTVQCKKNRETSDTFD